MTLKLPDGRTGPSSIRYRLVFSLVALFVLVVATAWAGIALTRMDGRIAAVWLPNAIIVCWALRSRFGARPALAVGFAGNVSANLLHGDSVASAIALALVNLFEVLLLCGILRRLGCARPDFTRNPDIVRFALAAATAAGCSGVAAAVALNAGSIEEATTIWWQWSPADTLGLLIFVPSLSIFADAFGRRRALRRKEALHLTGLVVAALAVWTMTFWQVRYPFLFLAIPVALLFTIRLGAVGSALATVLLALVASVATWNGYGPIHLVDGGLGARLLVLQLFLACAFASSLPVAALIAARIEQERRGMRLAAALTDANRTFSALTDVSPAGIFRTDAQGACTFVNPAWLGLSGLSREGAMGAGWADALHADDRARIAAGWADAVADERNFTEEFRFQRSDGSIRWVQVLASPIRDEQGAVSGYVGLNVDITAHKTLEAKLSDARAQAERSAHAKSDFLANMSHEIRTPMNGVLGFTDLLLSTDLDPAQHRYATSVADAGKAMMELLNDILDISKIEAGKLELVDEPYDFRAKVATCVQLMESAAAERGIALEAHVSDHIPDLVLGDRLRIRQVLLDLIGNAVKFTHEGRVRIDARLADAPDGAQRVVIAIEDSGIGIAPDKLDAIFSQFSQADTSIERNYGGTGLGLAICTNLVRLMGGRITVESEEGRGSCSTVDLPLRTATERRSPVRPEDLAYETNQASGGTRILVAEDNDLNRLLIVEMLRQGDYVPDLAANGAEAIEMVEEAAHQGRPYDIVLMDLQMPRVNGLMATRQLRAAGFDAETLPIVALTANCYAEDIAQCNEAGMQGHLPKPVKVEALLRAVRRFAVGGEGVEETETTPAADMPTRDALAEAYRKRRNAMARALRAAMRGSRPVEWQALMRQLHQIAGTAAYFGEEEHGELAKRLERALDTASDDAQRRSIIADEAAPLLRAA